MTDVPPPDIPRDAPPVTDRRWVRTVGGIVFYFIGIGLLVWYVTVALSRKEIGEEVFHPWRIIRDANLWLVAGMFVCSLANLLFNGTIFWLTIRPIQNVGWPNMQRLNLVGNALNYLPLRPGLFLRVGYHMRVDRLGILQIGAWFAAIAVVMLLVIGVCGAAILIHPHVDLMFAAILIAGLVGGGWMTYLIFGHPLVVRYGKGADRMLRSHRVLWPMLGLRLLDVLAFSGRVGCAAAIVGVKFDSGGSILLLGLVAILLRLLPVQLGFREVLLGLAATRIGATAMTGQELDAAFFALLALTESAGEMLVVIPLGAASLPWYRKRWTESKRSPSNGAGAPPGDS